MHSSKDSGLASLTMLLSFYKKSVNPEQIKHEYLPEKDRYYEDDIVKVARKMECKARTVTSSMKRLQKIGLPAIAKDKNDQFFIIGKINGDQVLIQRPFESPASWSLQDLEKEWSGVLILITPRSILVGKERAFGFSWFIPSIVKYRKLLMEVLLASFFIQIFALVSPLFFQVIIDKVLVHHGLTTLHVMITGMLFIVLFEVLLGGLRTYLFSHTTSRIDVELGSRLFRHLTSLPIAYFATRQVGQTVARVRELENIRQFLTGSALTLIVDCLFTVIFFAVMFYYSPLLTYIVLGSIPFYAGLSIFITPPLRKSVEEKFQRGAVNQSFLVESVSGMETLKSSATEPQMRKHWDNILAAYVKSSFKVITLGMMGSQGVTLVNKIVMALILWVGATLVIDGALTIGQLIAFNMFAGHVSQPILRLAQLWQDFQQMRISVDRLGDVLNTPTETQYQPNRPSLPAIEGRVVFDRISFRYEPGGKEIIKQLSLEVNPGQVIGVVGRSGSGKSTLTKLLQRLYVPEQGRVLIDGVDLAMVDTSWLRRQVGVVLQENILFNRSVRDNIALSDPALSMEKVIEVAKLAGAHEFILELKHGYDTEIGERGESLSGGQRQRIAIARALISNPRILIFDEATSALDYESESIIQKNMQSICAKRTVFIVAHRLSALRDADHIVVMDKGMIVEQGAHETLLSQNGHYAYLYRLQHSGKKENH